MTRKQAAHKVIQPQVERRVRRRSIRRGWTQAARRYPPRRRLASVARRRGRGRVFWEEYRKAI